MLNLCARLACVAEVSPDVAKLWEDFLMVS